MLVHRKKQTTTTTPAPGATQEQVQVEKPAPESVVSAGVHKPIRRLTHANTAVNAAEVATKAKAAIDAQLKLISEAEAAIDAATENIAQAYKVVEAQLKLADLKVHTDGVYLAEIVEQWTKQARNIDPKKFKNQVANEVFWSSISVSLTKAGAHLTEKEINEIADIVPAKMTGEALKIKKLGSRKKTPKE